MVLERQRGFVPVSQDILDPEVNESLKVRHEQALRLSLSGVDTQTHLLSFLVIRTG